MNKRLEHGKRERTGLQNKNKEGYTMTIIDYVDYHNVFVEFDDEDKTVVKTTFYYFSNGGVQRIKDLKGHRTGEVRVNNQGCSMTLVEYIDARNVIVEFNDEYRHRVKTDYNNFIHGKVWNAYYPSVYNVGVVGNKSIYDENGKILKEYKAWRSMIQRGYDPLYKEREPAYKPVTVCKEWHFFSNFYDWIVQQENYQKWLQSKGWQLDKDILVKGNKEYGPNTTCLVPHYINNLFEKNDVKRGEYPVGVSKMSNCDMFFARMGGIKKREYLGIYNTPEEAFIAYKNSKEQEIKRLAQLAYDSGEITQKCYEAMMSYQVEMGD